MTCPNWLMVIEHAAPIGIGNVSKDVESDVLRSTGVAGAPADGAVGVAAGPHATARPARRMTGYTRT
jgi:hypothetical protein